jgi:hypothetical protein
MQRKCRSCQWNTGDNFCSVSKIKCSLLREHTQTCLELAIIVARSHLLQTKSSRSSPGNEDRLGNVGGSRQDWAPEPICSHFPAHHEHLKMPGCGHYRVSTWGPGGLSLMEADIWFWQTNWFRGIWHGKFYSILNEFVKRKERIVSPTISINWLQQYNCYALYAVFAHLPNKWRCKFSAMDDKSWPRAESFVLWHNPSVHSS